MPVYFLFHELAGLLKVHTVLFSKRSAFPMRCPPTRIVVAMHVDEADGKYGCDIYSLHMYTEYM